MTVSVIVPAYNAGKYLGECLDSILSQSYRETEVIVVDDGSTDNTAAVADGYAVADSRLRIIRTPNRGVSAARNTGIEAATGEWIMFADSDDALLPGAIEALVGTAVAENVEIVSGCTCCKIPSPGGTEGKVTAISAADAVEQILYQTGQLLPSAWGNLFSRRLWASERFQEGERYEDLDIFYRIFLLADRVAYTDRDVYFYRPNPESFINTFSPARLDALKVTARIEGYLSKRNPQLAKAARDRRLSANFNIFILLLRSGREKEYAGTADSCWELITAYRRESLFNPRVRPKNKLGILLSYLGRPIFSAVAKICPA